jgi:hypothetical protein
MNQGKQVLGNILSHLCTLFWVRLQDHRVTMRAQFLRNMILRGLKEALNILVRSLSC